MEKAFLSCLIQEADFRERTVQRSEVIPFSSSLHQHLFDIVKSLHQSGETFDLATLTRQLAAEAGIELSVAAERIAEIAVFAPMSRSGNFYLSELLDNEQSE